MSPEQAQGLKTLDHRADLWAMGVLVYECLSGARPFNAGALGPLIGCVLAGRYAPLSSIVPPPGVPPQLDAWMARALAHDPDARFASAKELADAFAVASGLAPSMDRDLSSAGSELGPMSAQVVESSRAGLVETVRLEGAPAKLAPIPASAVRTRPGDSPPAAKTSLPLPWIIVAVLTAAVVALSVLLAMKR
jgi:serine/threonine-protein kinase